MWDRLLRSRLSLVIVAVVLVLAALSTQIRVQPAARSGGDLDDFLALRDRNDVNVVFVLVDTLRADHLHSYGYERKTSPFLDEVASNGIRFAHVRSQSSWTKTSMASMLTATFPVRNGVLTGSHALPQDLAIAPEIFQKAGFRTGGIYRNGWVAPNFGFGRGYELYLRPMNGQREDKVDRNAPGGRPLQGTDFDVTEAAVEFFKVHAHDRFFLYLHLMDVHQYLYEEESALFGTQYVDAYDNAIHWTDRNLSALYKGLYDLGLLEKTMIVIAADHGEGFREHGFEGHGRTLYAEVTETPWIISPPFNLEGGVTVEERVRNVDIFPTILDILGLPALPEAQGESVLPLIEAAARNDGAAKAPERIDEAYLNMFWGRMDLPVRPTAAYARDGFRVIHDVCTGRSELYDLAKDPKELVDLAKDQPEKTADLTRALKDALAADAAGQSKPVDVAIDAMRMEQLKALGYVLKDGEKRPELGDAAHSNVSCQPLHGGAPAAAAR
jgi:arylsulfatase A-like enzyme